MNFNSQFRWQQFVYCLIDELGWLIPVCRHDLEQDKIHEE